MALERPLRTGFVRAAGPHFVAVDQVQPVAMSLPPSGDVLDLASWPDQISPASADKRTIASSEDRVFVHDWPSSLPAPTAPRTPLATVAVAVDPDGPPRRVHRNNCNAPMTGCTFGKNGRRRLPSPGDVSQ